MIKCGFKKGFDPIMLDKRLGFRFMPLRQSNITSQAPESGLAPSIPTQKNYVDFGVQIGMQLKFVYFEKASQFEHIYEPFLKLLIVYWFFSRPSQKLQDLPLRTNIQNHKNIFQTPSDEIGAP